MKITSLDYNVDEMDIYKKVRTLEALACIEGSESGDVWYKMTELLSFADYYSEEFLEAIHKEIDSALRNVKNNCKIDTYQSPSMKTPEYILEWQ